jgi:hypothetical protein
MMKRTTRGGGILLCRRAMCLALTVGLARALAEDFTVIYGHESWYRERSEPEREWSGVLRPRQPERGPGSRDALRFRLQAGGRSIPVYSPGSDRRLNAFVGKPVVARARLVDLRSEGFGEELWIGAVRVDQ